MNEHRVELVLGSIVLIAPWVFGFSNISLAKWVDVFTGLILILISSWILFVRPPSEHVGAQEERKSRKNKTATN